MSITDELREYATTRISPNKGMLEAIADRIDEEHEKSIVDALLNDGLPMSDEVMAEHGWVRLPMDADNLPIRIGDVMEWPTTRETFEVVGIGDGVLFYIEDGSEKADWTGATTKRHHHAPTVEDVLREFASEVYADADNEIRDRDFLCAKYAKRLKLAEGEDA